MPRNVNVSITNIRLTGVSVSVPQRAFDLSATWTKDDDTQGSTTQTVNFPNILTNAALPAGWLQQQLIDLCIRAARVIAGVDTAR